MLGCDFPALVQGFALGFPALCPDQVTGIDIHRAGGLAHAIHGTGLDHIVYLLGFEPFRQVIGPGSFAGGDGTLDDDPLPGCGGQVLGGADGFAVAAFHAVVDDVSDGFGGFDVFEVQLRVIGDDGARVENAVGVAGVFDVNHGLVEVVTVLALHEGGHDSAGAVLGLEGALFPEHEVHHVFGELVVAVKGFFTGEVLGDEEVDIAVFGVSEDDGAVIVVFVEEFLQVGADSAEFFHGDGNVFQQGHGALGAVAHDLGVESVAHDPHLVAAFDVAGHFGRGGEPTELGEGFFAGGDAFGDAVVVHGLVFDEQGGVFAHLEALGEDGGCVGAHCPDGCGVDKLNDFGAGVHDLRQGLGGGVKRVEHEQAGGGALGHGDGAEDCFGDKAQGAFGPDHEVFEDFRGRVVVEEGVNAVAHGVFDGVAAFDVGTVFVAAEGVAESFEYTNQLGFVRAQDVVGVGVGGVDHGAAGEGDGHGFQGAVGVGGSAAGHAG